MGTHDPKWASCGGGGVEEQVELYCMRWCGLLHNYVHNCWDLYFELTWMPGQKKRAREEIGRWEEMWKKASNFHCSLLAPLLCCCCYPHKVQFSNKRRRANPFLIVVVAAATVVVLHLPLPRHWVVSPVTVESEEVTTALVLPPVLCSLIPLLSC